jgi:thiol:disulfide interchange protein DsbA
MRALLAFIPVVFSLVVFSQHSLAQYQEGKDYTRLTVPLKASAKRIQVEEFFAYSCPHCSNFEGQVVAWKMTKPTDVELVQVPVAWQLQEEGERGHHMVVNAKAYYLAKALKVLDKVHPAMFEAVLQQRKTFSDADDLWPIFEAAGVDRTKYDSLYKGFGINAKVKLGHSRQLGAKVTGTPEVIVNGAYSVKPNPGLDVMAVVDFLINKIRIERAAAEQ